MGRRIIRMGAALAALGALAGGCSVNPVSGRPEVVLTSTERERALGQEAAQQVQQVMGLVEDPDLVAYVARIGARLAQHSPRTDVSYEFRIVDMEEPNAFALPGGPVYLSRGLLVLLNSEDELANVLGHEIGHVAARHHVRSQVRRVPFLPLRIATGIGGGAVGVVSPLLGQIVSGVGKLPGALALSAYSRDQEREADRVGQQLAAAAGWDPAAMAAVMETLGREEALKGGDPNRQSFFASHPTSPERSANNRRHAATLARAPGQPLEPERAGFVGQLTGLLVGTPASEGVFDENEFLHPELGFVLRFPAEWKTVNASDVVAAQEPGERAVAMLQLAKEGESPLAAARAFAARAKVELIEGPAEGKVGSLPAARAVGRARANGRAMLELVWIAHGEHVYQISGVAPPEHFEAVREQLRAVGDSFRPLRAGDRPRIVEARLRVVRARAGDDLAAIGARTKATWSVEELAVANGLEEDAKLSQGWPVKLPIAEAYAGEWGAR